MLNKQKIEQYLGWVANFGFIMGAIWLAQKQIIGFQAQVIANFLYMIQSIMMKNQPLFRLSLVLIFINLYGILEWSNLLPLF